MKLKSLFTASAALLIGTLMSVSALAQTTTTTTVLDFGAIQDGQNGLVDATAFTETIEAGDPATTLALFQGASQGDIQPGTPGADPFSFGGGVATISWNNVAGWNNNPNDIAGDTYIRNVAGNVGDFTVTPANPTDLVTIDFVAGTSRDANVTINGTTTNVGVYALGSPWVNVVTNSVGTTTGTLTEALVQGNAPDLEGNIGAARITITSGGVAIPEPSSLALLGMGAFALVLRRRR
ncbi:PEP-CTERM sorting domain-containing protein [bacterium]|nr:PEP-CTERM sorting domain-containing protein [bacterium]